MSRSLQAYNQAELPMYVAAAEVRQANELWLAHICRILDIDRERADWPGIEAIWLAPHLLLTQTCGYPLVTMLRGRVKVIGKPVYELPYATGGHHRSLLLARGDDGRTSLADYCNSRGVINEDNSNTGMNLFRHRLLALRKGGRFFATLERSGGHQESVRWLREGRADLAAVDSVMFAYLSRFAAREVQGLKVVALSAVSPCLPYIGSVDLSEGHCECIRSAMNQALQDLPRVGAVLGIDRVLPGTATDYEVLLQYAREAADAGFEL